METRHKCPEFACGLKLRHDELLAHLQWDHNRSAHEAERMVEENCDIT